jgi:hypothetical protein
VELDLDAQQIMTIGRDDFGSPEWPQLRAFPAIRCSVTPEGATGLPLE